MKRILVVLLALSVAELSLRESNRQVSPTFPASASS